MDDCPIDTRLSGIPIGFTCGDGGFLLPSAAIGALFGTPYANEVAGGNAARFTELLPQGTGESIALDLLEAACADLGGVHLKCRAHGGEECGGRNGKRVANERGFFG